MFAKTFGATTLGIDGMLIEVEADVTNGLPKFEIVGLADIAVKEARERGRFAQERLHARFADSRCAVAGIWLS